MKKGTLPPSMDVPGIDPATLAALIGDASNRAIQPAEAATLSRLIRIAKATLARVGALPISCWRGGTPALAAVLT
jgi:hypothetical protein